MIPSRHRATRLEVARQAGTYQTSVSRYFGGERERLSRELQERIAEAAQRPRTVASHAGTGTIGGCQHLRRPQPAPSLWPSVTEMRDTLNALEAELPAL